jgi:type III pantothenate kinase
MFLAIDIGNSNIVVGEWQEDHLRFVSRLATDKLRTSEDYAVTLNSIFELHGVEFSEIEGAIISSVVPQLTSSIANAVELVTGVNPLIVGPGVKTGLNIKIDDPAQLGSDLVGNAVAAVAKYPTPIIIVDMGTATTVCAVDKNADFLGAIIVPGLRLGLDSLSAAAAQLPYIALEVPRDIIGRNSIDSMKSGALYGTASMIDGLVQRLEERLGQKASVVITGGNAGKITEYCKTSINYDPNLLLEGLRIIYMKNTHTS